MQDEARLKSSNHWAHGYHFLKWGIWFFIFGVIFGFGVLIHYLVGSDYNTSNSFLSNITLWFGSPLSLSVTYLQLGGLAMAIIGGVALCLCRHLPDTTYRAGTEAPRAVTGADAACCKMHKGGKGALFLCILGLIALFVTGYIGYFIIDAMWPGFYYAPIPAAKNLWLILQGLSILCFLIGLIIAASCFCCCKKDHDVRNGNHRV